MKKGRYKIGGERTFQGLPEKSIFQGEKGPSTYIRGQKKGLKKGKRASANGEKKKTLSSADC